MQLDPSTIARKSRQPRFASEPPGTYDDDVAINVDDMDDFLMDVGKLAIEKYGGATFEELVYEDENDSVADRSTAQLRKESADRVVSEAEEITKEALGKRGIARMPGDDPIEFFLRDYLDEFENGIVSEGLMEDAHECGIAALAVEFRTEGLDAEDIEEAPGGFVAMLSLSQLLGCLAWHFKRETWAPGSIKVSIGSGAMYRYAAAYLEDLGKTTG